MQPHMYPPLPSLLQFPPFLQGLGEHGSREIFYQFRKVSSENSLLSKFSHMILPMLQVVPLNPVEEQLQLNPPFPSLEHTPLFLQGFGEHGSNNYIFIIHVLYTYFLTID